MSQGFRSVTASAPCPACGKSDWCAWTHNGLLKCERTADAPNGYRLVKPQAGGGLFAPIDAHVNGRAPHRSHSQASARPSTTIDWAAEAARTRGAIAASEVSALAADLGVAEASLLSIGIGWATQADLRRYGASGKDWQEDYPDGAFTFPERDGAGRVVGLSLRAKDGRKGSPSSKCGAHRGLIIPDTLAGISGPVFAVEGPSDVAAMLTMGIAAVGRPSNTSGVLQVARLLNGRNTIVVGENDQKPDGAWPGRDGAESTAIRLASEWRTPASWTLAPEGTKDVRAWLQARLVGGLDRTSDAGCKAAGEELVQLLLATAREEEPEKRPPQSELLVRLALERYRLGVTDADEPFTVACEGPNIALMFRGSREALRSTLAREFRRKYGSTPNASALADAITVLQGEALECAHEPVHLRVAEHEDGIVIDLGDPSGAVVFVRPGGWAVQAVSPVVFRRTALSGALPVPERGGSLEELRPLVNTTDATWSLLLGWIVAACTPSVPHPVLLLGGEQGAGKTTTAVFSLGLFDPSPAPVRSPPRDPEAWAISCAGSWGVAVDNISFIPDWFSDALCKAVTGDGWMRRKLYTDGEIAVLSFRRVIALTSIDVGALRGDLADRLLIVDLLPIDRRNRRSKRQLDRLYERARPRILGAVLDLLAAVLNALPSIDLAEMPRMADFAQVLAAMDRVLGTASLAEYESQATRIAEEVVDDDPVGAAIVAFAHKVGSWSGTTEELGNRIKPETPPKDWPKTPRALSSRFRRLITVLRASGIELRPPSRTDKTRTWCLQLLGEQPPATASTAQSPANGRPDTGRGDSDRAVGTAQTGDRPSNRPTDGPSAVAEERDTGRSGGSGGQNRSPSVAPGPPHPCFGCGRLKWFSLAGLQHWTCGSCHDPSAHMGDVIWWHGNEVRE